MLNVSPMCPLVEQQFKHLLLLFLFVFDFEYNFLVHNS